ncbi:hypothetical protein CFK40_04090 [Virgibacillus necropolis]|uniref:Uncharacterized protein n=1 Tax=Virgibacillus necropolis TaxID=163877 RepID=A0A221M9A8_9BACI|nr:hypothetical protein CFK40_04090 [Virgibacillus necropolis]
MMLPIGINIVRKQKALLNPSRSRTDDELLKKTYNLGIADIYTDNKGLIKRKKKINSEIK